MLKINFLILLTGLILALSLAPRAQASTIPGVTTPLTIPTNVAPCSQQYYTYQQPLKDTSPTLADLFDGKAHFQSLSESKALQFTPWIDGPSKMKILH